MKIGILAIQGSVAEHRKMLEALNIEVSEVRLSKDLGGISGIILPGGESTTQSKLMKHFGLFNELKNRIKEGLPAWGTCAGAILLSKKVIGKNCPPTLELMDIKADRNAYGTQVDSFENILKIRLANHIFIQGVFIRAPKLFPLNNQVEILCEHQGQSVMLRQDHLLATSFHPELTDDTSIHNYFVHMCE